jgi:hypothetical protein
MHGGAVEASALKPINQFIRNAIAHITLLNAAQTIN